MQHIRLSAGSILSLGRELARGGEGTIFEVSNSSDQLAKLYHKPPDQATYQKLIAMVQLRRHDLEAVSAWPSDLIFDAQDKCVGFVMPHVRAAGNIDNLSHPAERRLSFPNIDFGFLVHVAANLMRAASCLHGYGCVIGDINQSNVRVLNDGTIRFIDVDSFQIDHCAVRHFCNVGTPLFTPPELQGQSFAGLNRSSNHDCFGLAVLLFQLLVFGRHPFAGIAADGQVRAPEEAIRHGLYAYSMRLASRITPPPDTLPIFALGELETYFERTFLNSQRPSASEWMHALDRTRSSLRQCSQNSRHQFIASTGRCSLCDLKRDPLPDLARRRTVSGASISIDDLLREVAVLDDPTPIDQRCQEAHIDLNPPKFEREQPVQTVAGWCIAAGLVMALLCTSEVSERMIGVGLALIGFILWGVAGAIHTLAKTTWEKRTLGMSEAFQTLIAVVDEAKSHQLAVNIEMRNRRVTMEPAKKCLSDAENLLTTALRRADEAYYESQMTEKLRRRFLSHAEIPKIGPSRKAVLSSFGIETAADITYENLSRILGFGPNLISRLLSWRKKCEEAEKRKHHFTAPADWLQKIKDDHTEMVHDFASSLRVAINDYKLAYQLHDAELSTIANRLDLARRECRLFIDRCGQV